MHRRVATLVLLLVATACPADKTRAPVQPPAPPSAFSLLYALTGPDRAAQIKRYDLRTGRTALLVVDRAERFGELVGSSSGRDDFRTPGAWIGSPAGRYVARLSATELSVAPAGDPRMLRPIARPTSTRDVLGSTGHAFPDRTDFLWSPDEARLFYLQSRIAPRRPNVETYGAPAESSLYEVRRDGSHVRLVKRFRKPKFVQLVGFDPHRRLIYWVQTGEGGGVADLTAVSVTDGRARVVDHLEQAVGSIELSLLAHRAFYINADRRIVEIDLIGDERRVLYEPMKGATVLQALNVSPDGSGVSFEEGTENRVSTVFLSLSDGRRRVLAEKDQSASVPASWSPDGRYLLLGDRRSCGQGVSRPHLGILDLRTAQVTPAGAGELSCPTVETDTGSPAVRFLAWLAS